MVLIRSSVDIRTHNLYNIVFELSKKKKLYRKDLGKSCGLSQPAVYNLCSLLQSKGVIEKVEPLTNRKKKHGRIPREIKLTDDLHFFLIINVQKINYMTISLMNLKGEGLGSVSHPVNYDSIELFIQTCADKIDQLLEETQIPKEKVRGASVVLAGIYDERWKEVRTATRGFFENIELKLLLETRLNMAVSLGNDANLAALYSHLFRKKAGTSLAYLLLDEGLGSGMVIDGKLYFGERGYATEISCLPLGGRSGEAHFCGMYDCAEQLLNISAFYTAICGQLKTEEKLLSSREQWNFCQQSLNTPEHEALWELIFREKGRYLGTLCSIITMIFDMKTIIFGGLLAKLTPRMEPWIIEGYKQRTIGQAYRHLETEIDFSYEETIQGGANCMAIAAWLTEIATKV